MHKAFKKVRIIHELKQFEVAEKIAVARSHYSEVENGRKGFSMDFLTNFCKLFNLKIYCFVAFGEWLESPNKQNREMASFEPILKSLIHFEESKNDKYN